jgi:pimeloyl-ACP methyl ester carboxylesterase
LVDIVLVPGSYHGAWYYAPIIPALQATGHRVFGVTPTGLGDRRHLTNAAINLDTHIEDVVSLFENEKVADAVLVGHSYGGMIISGVSSRLPGRVRSLVYLDAIVPQDGQALWDLITDPLRGDFLRNTTDGLTTVPPPGLDERVAPHPLATFFQPIRIRASAFDVPRKVYVWAEGWAEGPFGPIYTRLAEAGGWEMHKVPFGHDLMNEAPDLVKEAILAAAEGRRYGWVLPSEPTGA